MKNLFIVPVFLFFFVNLSGQIGIKIVSNGDVAIGHSNPVEQLDVDGAIKIGTTNSTNAGTIRWNGTCFEGYNGTEWVTLSNDSACSSGGGGNTATCTDGIQNQGETGIDCGGPCAPCGGGGGGACAPCFECFPDISGERDMPNTGWNNEFNVGGTALSGDGEMCFKIGTIENYSLQAIGLDADPSTSPHFNTIDHAFQLQRNAANYRVRIYENGLYRGQVYFSTTTSFSGSTFCIRRSGTTVEYLINGTIEYTSTLSSTGDLFFDNSFYDNPSSNTWGVRPCEFNVDDIKTCPIGQYTLTEDPISAKKANIPSEEEASRKLRQLQEEYNALKNDINKLVTETKNSKTTYDFVMNASLTQEEPVLDQNRPNPFTDKTVIEINLPQDYESANLEVLNNQGKLIKVIPFTDKGKGQLTINSTNLSAGLYTYLLKVDGKLIDSKKMIISK